MRTDEWKLNDALAYAKELIKNESIPYNDTGDGRVGAHWIIGFNDVCVIETMCNYAATCPERARYIPRKDYGDREALINEGFPKPYGIGNDDYFGLIEITHSDRVAYFGLYDRWGKLNTK